MNFSPNAALRQRVVAYAGNSGVCDFYNLLTGPQLLDRVEALLPKHRDRTFPPTETLAMFLAQALSADGSCRQAVDDAAGKRIVGCRSVEEMRTRAEFVEITHAGARESHVHDVKITKEAPNYRVE